MTFEELDLEDEILDGLWDMNFRECTQVQELAIPILLKKKDVIACAQTGTGKTAAYLLPILNNLLKKGKSDAKINAVIMVPTRELAMQIDQQIQGFAYFLPVTSIAIYGGTDGIVYEQQKRGLQKGADIVVATPGRLLSYINLGLIDLSKVEYFILDEADRMLDMGFNEDISNIVAQTPKNRQTMLFSATMPSKIKILAQKILKNPEEIKIAVSKPNEKIIQSAYICYEKQKTFIVENLFETTKPDKVIIFSSSKIKVKEVTRALRQMKLPVSEMHSDLNQKQREDTITDFKSGKIKIIVATDIISRGIDIEDISCVINFDVPNDAEDYVHRIGRTARADADGLAITLVSVEDQENFKKIEDFLGKSIYKIPLSPDFGETPTYAPEKNGKNKRRFSKNSNRKR